MKRPVLRYPGGKFKIRKWTITHFPPHKLYIETHGGAGSCLMEKNPSTGEIYNDINKDIVGVFEVLRNAKQAARLKKLLALTPFSYIEYQRAYQRSKDPVEMARRIIFRSFASIGSNGVTRPHSGFRGLKNNETAVTSAQEWSRYHEMIPEFTKRLEKVILECRPAERLFSIYDRTDSLFYIDPPYLMETRAKGSRLYEYEMKNKDNKDDKKTERQMHIELSKQIMKLKGMVIIAGYTSTLYSELYKDWQCVRHATTAQNGKARVECIWISPNIQPMLFPGFG